MNIVVLVKSIPDPNGDAELGDDFLVKRDGEGTLDPGDEYAVEAALQLAEATTGEVTVVSMGPAGAVSAIRRALSMGAHRAVLVSDDALRGSDVLATARVLAAAIGRAPFDLVLTGVESTDGYTGTLPMTVAELLGLPAATFARKLDVVGDVKGSERRSPSLGNQIAALGVRQRRCEEAVGPLLRELPRVGEDDLDLGVAHLQASKAISDECGGDVLELEQR